MSSPENNRFSVKKSSSPRKLQKGQDKISLISGSTAAFENVGNHEIVSDSSSGTFYGALQKATVGRLKKNLSGKKVTNWKRPLDLWPPAPMVLGCPKVMSLRKNDIFFTR